MKKVLYITNIAGAKFSINFVGSALAAAKSLGIDFYVVANRSASNPEQIAADEKEYGVHLLHADISRSPLSLSNVKAYKQICEIIRKYDIDYIHCNTPVGGVLGRLAGKKCKIKKIIYQAHGFHFYKGAPLKNWFIFYPIEKFLAHYTDVLLTINHDDYELAKKKFHLKKKGKVGYIHGVGIEINEYRSNEYDVREIRNSLGLPDHSIVLISIGELNDNKNNSVILKAMARIQNPNLHYLLCGVGCKKTELENLAKQLNIEKNVHFLGYRNDVKALYQLANVFVMPSFREGLSRSLMEAMASGLPCIVSRIRGNVDLIKDGKGGYLCDPRNENEFANAIQRCLLEDISSFGKYNKTVVEQYDISVVQEELGCIYKSMQ